MKGAEVKLLKKLCGRAKPAELKALFKLARANSDRVLLKALAPVKKKPAKKSDPLVRSVEQTFRPLMANSAEKADLLVEHMARAHKKKLAIEPRGLADAVKRLRKTFNDEQILAGAQNQVRKLSALYGKRETVV